MSERQHKHETQHATVWPATYLAGSTDNHVSNEIAVAGLGAAQARARLNDTTAWLAYHANASDIVFHDGSGPLRPAPRPRSRQT